MLRKIGSCSVLLCVVSMPVVADPGPGNGQAGLYYDGVAELEYSFSDDLIDRGLLGRLDARVGYLGPDFGRLQFGGELGVDAYDIEGSGDLTALQAIGYVVTEFGTVSIGQPFSADADYLPETLFDRSVLNYLALAVARPDVRLITQLTDDPVPGLRYDGQFGNFSGGLSFHSFTEGDGATAVSAAANYDFSLFTLSAAVNRVETDAGDDFSSWSIATEGGYGPFGGLLEVSNFDGDTTAYTVEGTYTVNDRFAVGVGLTEFDFTGGGPDTSWLVEAEYGFNNGAFINATAGRTFGNSEANVGIGLDF